MTVFIGGDVYAVQGSRAVCLQRIYCHPDAEAAKSANAEVAKKLGKPFIDNSDCIGKSGHRVQLSSYPFLDYKAMPNAPAYVVECFSYIRPQESAPQLICTTGDAALDKKAFCGQEQASCTQANSLSYLQSDIGYSLSHDNSYGIYLVNAGRTLQKTGAKEWRTDASGNIPVLEWQSYSQGQNRSFRAISTFEVSAVSIGEIGQKQGTSIFEAPGDKGCVTIGWDPAGRVFDAVTLEPISAASVLLYKKYGTQFRSASESEIGINNPFVVAEDGKFSFVVEDGTYKLSVSAINYSFPITDINKINPGYTKIYKHETDKYPVIYPVLTDEEIEQRDKEMQRRDIPLLPSNRLGYQYPLVVKSIFQETTKAGDAVFRGEVSHPLSTINVYTLLISQSGSALQRNRKVGSYTADNDGKFVIAVSTKDLQPNETYGELDFVKNDLRGSFSLIEPPTATPSGKSVIIDFFDKLVEDVEAQQGDKVGIILDPIPNHVEGYAYDSSGKIIPKAVVGVYLTISDKVYFETQADDRGYFKIDSSNLPSIPYILKYTTSTGNMVKTSTSKFISQNVNFLKEKNISVYTSDTKAGANNIEPTKILTPGTGQTSLEPQVNQPNTSNNNQAVNNQGQFIVLVGLIMLLLIGIVGGILGFYLLKRRSEQTPY